MDPVLLPEKQPASLPSCRLVFINRVDTFFGKILAQHLGHITSHLSDLDKIMNEDFSDLNFLHTEAKLGSFDIFGSWRPQEHTNPFQPTPHPPRVPALHGLCRSDNYPIIAKTIAAADICIFPIVDEDGKNRVLEDTLRNMQLVKPYLQTASEKRKIMILISTVMTWANTKQIPVPSDMELLKDEPNRFADEEFRRRKPHPSFRGHFHVENEFLKLGDESGGILHNTIIGAGVIYGYGENNLLWMFKQGFTECQAIKFFDCGVRHMPVIYARDLCQIVQNVCSVRPRNCYVLAMDEEEVTTEEIAAAISLHVSRGGIEKVPGEELLLRNTITALQYDLFSTNLRMGATSVRDMKIKWSFPLGFAKAASRLVKEFRILRNLMPIKLAVIGMPFAGKTTLAKRLSVEYGLQYIDVQQIVQSAIADLEKRYEIPAKLRADSKGQGKEAELSTGDQDGLALLDAISASKEKNAGQISDTFVRKFVREVLEDVPCQNHGFVLDAYPESYISARELFISHVLSTDHKENDKQQISTDSDGESTHNIAIIPDYVISLEAPEEFLKKLMLSYPFETSGIPVEMRVAQRFAEYNFLNTDDDNVSAFYEEIGKNIMSYEMFPDFEKAMETAITSTQKRVGIPRMYPLSPESKLQILRQEAESRIKEVDSKAKEKYFQEKLESVKKERLCNQWKEELEMLHHDEFSPPDPKKMAMRQYLMTYVLPVLATGILSAIAERPADPVDYLAEHILKNSTPLYIYDSIPFTKMTANANKQDSEPRKLVPMPVVIPPYAK